METPSSILYLDLKVFGRISNREAAALLLSPTFLYGGQPIVDRLTDRTFLSREIVHANPRTTPPDRFGDLSQASLTLFSRLVSQLGGGQPALDAVRRHYRDEASATMRQVLDGNGLDGSLYANALTKIEQAQLAPGHDRGILYLMLFAATGCLGDPLAATRVVDGFVASKLAADLHTVETTVGEDFAAATEAAPGRPTGLGLLRIVDGMVKAPLHMLSSAPEGTVLGALASGPADITDVDGDVSRRHLRIWREGSRWLAQGLESTNGSTVISGDTRDVRIIEPPRRLRDASAEYPPVELLNSDTICLGATTRFLVVQTTR